MDWVVRASWFALAAIHAAPAAAAFSPALVARLYDVAPSGALGVLLSHRGGLFLAILTLTIWAAFDPGARRAAAAATAVSVISFLILYLRAGAPEGALRTIARVDAFALLPLAIVTFDAWRGRA
ncbi:MAG: hypothetical protein NW203_07715 [Hyphomonadaceae bacterium]|nr:hypothetical protein [Hyphomonadaceae bacterium]